MTENLDSGHSEKEEVVEEMSRRRFLKMVGMGAGGATLAFSGFGSLLPGGILEKLFGRLQTGTVDLSNVEPRSSDPEDPEPYQIWLREDLMGEN